MKKRLRDSSVIPAPLTLLLVTALCASARGDGGTLRGSSTVGPYRLTVFTSPTPPRAGRLDVSVLVQDAATSAIQPDAKVTVRVAPVDRSGAVRTYAATQRAATNKLFRAAECELAAAGQWRIEVAVQQPRDDAGTRKSATGRAGSYDSVGRPSVAFELTAAEPLPPWWDMVLWIGWPIVAIGLYAAHQSLSRTGKARRS